MGSFSPRTRRTTDARDITIVAASIALLSVSAWVTVPFGPVPFTLQTMVLVFVVLALNARRAFASVCGYVVLGAIGLPLFSGMRGGIGVIAGPTGGFIVGFVLGTLVAIVVMRLVCGLAGRVVAAASITVVSYLVGWAWLMVSLSLDPVAAFMAGCAPFVVPDLVKTATGMFLARAVTAALPQLSAQGR